MPVCRCVQAGDVRTSIGSGLIQLGLHPKSAVGLYSINSKGECSGEEEGGDCIPGERRRGESLCIAEDLWTDVYGRCKTQSQSVWPV